MKDHWYDVILLGAQITKVVTLTPVPSIEVRMISNGVIFFCEGFPAKGAGIADDKFQFISGIHHYFVIGVLDDVIYGFSVMNETICEPTRNIGATFNFVSAFQKFWIIAVDVQPRGKKFMCLYSSLQLSIGGGDEETFAIGVNYERFSDLSLWVLKVCVIILWKNWWVVVDL